MNASKQQYDASTLVEELRAVLNERGMDPQLPSEPDNMSIAAAAMMLRSFGIAPLAPMEDVIDRLSASDER